MAEDDEDITSEMVVEYVNKYRRMLDHSRANEAVQGTAVDPTTQTSQLSAFDRAPCPRGNHRYNPVGCKPGSPPTELPKKVADVRIPKAADDLETVETAVGKARREEEGLQKKEKEKERKDAVAPTAARLEAAKAMEGQSGA